MPTESRFESRKPGDPLFVQGGEVRTNVTKHHGPFLSAEAAGNFLLDFDHAQVPLGLIVP